MQQISLGLAEAQAQGMLGMERAAERNERHHPGWIEMAVHRAERHVAALPAGEHFTMESLRAAIEADLPEPTDLRAWGAVTQALLRRLVIKRTAKVAPAISSHGSIKPMYERGSI